MKKKFLDNSFNFLVVEDCMVMQKVIVSSLKNIGYKNIYTAYDGHNAWDVLTSHKIDIILSDLAMPRMGGLELLTKIRASDEYWNTPFIVISSETRQSRIISSTEEEIDAYIVKPLTTNTLAKHVNKILENRYAPDAYYSALHYAKAELRKGNTNEALMAFQEANALNRSQTTPYFYMGQILEEFNQDDMALQSYNKCDDQSNSLYVRAFDGLSRIHIKRGNYSAAAKALRQAVDASPANMDRTITLARCYHEIGDHEACKMYLREAALIVEGDIGKVEEIARIFFDYDFLKEAEAVLNKVYDKGARESKVFNQFGLMAKEKGEYEKSRAYYNAALQISPTSNVINYNCAILFIEMKEYHLAIAHLKRALLHHSEFKPGQDLLDKLNAFMASNTADLKLELKPINVTQ